uniref:FLYWCH-type domain-containing protein n=1 Tax=Meloidogyne incognita TaxID=6306 RepID=A0A914MUD1_MELIC
MADILTERGKPKFVHDGYLFVFHKMNKDEDIKFWRCEAFNKKDVKCKARLHSDLNNSVLRELNHHVCSVNPANVQKQVVVTGIKRRAIETMEPPATIRANAMENIPTPVLAQLPTKKATNLLVQRARRQNAVFPAVPQNINELEIPDRYQNYQRTDVLYGLLTNKTKSTYARFFRLVKEIWPQFNPRVFSTDYEAAIIGAIQEVFPRSDLAGCLFHLVRNLKKAICDANLMQRYKNDPLFAVDAKLITSIAFLPICDISLGIIALETYLPPELQPVLDWFITNYTGRLRMDGMRNQPRFDPAIWSVHRRKLHIKNSNGHSVVRIQIYGDSSIHYEKNRS